MPKHSLNYVGADKDKPDWRCFKDFMMKEGPLKKEVVIKLLKDGINLLSRYKTLLLMVLHFRQGTKHGKDRRADSHSGRLAWVVLRFGAHARESRRPRRYQLPIPR